MNAVQPGTIVQGRFVVAHFAGRGGMSEVYKAHDQDGSAVAIKVLRSPAAHLIERFNREIESLEQLEHPAIVRYLGSGVTSDDGLPYLVMEWLDGVELDALLRRQRLDLRSCLTLGLRMAEALGLAHASGIVHRDVKPSNIFLCGESVEHAKLLDFGIARWLQGGGLTRTGSRFGTPAYMAPEQVRGERGLDTRADVFSLGCVLFECLAGKPPFTAKDDMAIFGKILFQDVPRLSEELPELPRGVDDLVHEMLARSPDERPCDGTRVAARVRELQESLAPNDLARIFGEQARRDTLTMHEQRLVSVVVAVVALEQTETGGRPGTGSSAGPDAAGAAHRSGAVGDTDVSAEIPADMLPAADSAGTEVAGGAVVEAVGGAVVEAVGESSDGGVSGYAETLISVPMEAAVVDDGTGATRAGGPRPTSREEATDEALRTFGKLSTAVRGQLDAFGARCQLLENGLLVGVLENQDTLTASTAVDQACHAARCALALAAVIPDAPVALATGRIVVGRGRLMGEVIERAVSLVNKPPPIALDEDRAGGAFADCVRVDEVTALLIRDRFRVEGNPLAGLRLTRESAPESTAYEADDALPFVGRRGEIATLVATLEECVEEHVARALLVTGPAGYGKSRLCCEFLRRVADDGDEVSVWIAQGEPLRVGSPLHLFGTALRYALGREGDAAITRSALRAWVARRVAAEDVDRVTRFLGELLHLESAADEDLPLRAAREDAKLMNDQVRRACGDILAAECALRPLVLVLEDLHWGDRATVEVLDSALRSLCERPLLIVALGRPAVHDLFPKLWDAHDIAEIRLHNLSRRAAETLVRAVLGEDADDQHVSAMVERADGHPYYLEQLVRNGDARESLPKTVAAMVDARLCTLEPDARRVLRAASVFGPTFWSAGVAKLVGDNVDVGRWLDVLAAHDLIAPATDQRFAQAVAFSFRHDLLREGAYAMLTEDDRALGHRLAGAWLESVGEQDARVLAAHFHRGGLPARALPYYVGAAEVALASNDFDDAMEMVERGLECGAEGAYLGALRRVQMEEQIWCGDSVEVVRLGVDALALLPPGSRTWYEVLGEVATAYGKLGDEMHLTELAADLERRDDAGQADTVGRLIAIAKVSMACFATGAAERGQALLQQVEDALHALGGSEPILAGNVHFSRAFRAEFRDASPGAVLREFEQCVACFEAVGDRRRLCLHRRNVGYAKLELGLIEGAVTELRHALASAEELSLHFMANSIKQVLAVALAYGGDFEEGAALEDEALRWFREQDDVVMAALSRSYGIAIRCLAGDIEGAATALQRHMNTLPSHSPLRTQALAQYAWIALRLDQSAAALAHAERAVAMLEDPDEPASAEALVRLVYAEALHAAGEIERACEVIARARERLEERAARIDRDDWRESFLSRIPEHAATVRLARAWLGEAHAVE